MESSRFDVLTRLFAGSASRRRALGALATAALLPSMAAAAPQPAGCLQIGKRCAQRAAASDHAAALGPAGRKRRRSSCSKCCSRFGTSASDGKIRCACKPASEPCASATECCSGRCTAGSCADCPPGQIICADQCVDVQTDPRHCGTCDTACAAGQRCQDGACVCDATSCPTGCCQDAICKRGASDHECGANGAPCQQCAAGQRCGETGCICDPTSCPHGCCFDATCVPFENQTREFCGTGGEACVACASPNTCGGGGEKGKCGCTPNCADKCNGEADGCGGTCTTCPACQQCVGGICEKLANGTPCDSPVFGLRCCNGVCPPPATCLLPGACCADPATCRQICCNSAYAAGVRPDICASTFRCVAINPGGPCTGDRECNNSSPAACFCGHCCRFAGFFCTRNEECCSSSCDTSHDVCR